MTRDLLHDELDQVRERVGRPLTVLFVTHNVREAVRLGDRVVRLSSRPGRVIEECQVPVEQQDAATVPVRARQVTGGYRNSRIRLIPTVDVR